MNLTYRYSFSPFAEWIERRARERLTLPQQMRRIKRIIDELCSGRFIRKCISSGRFQFAVTRGFCLFFDYRHHPNNCRWIQFKVGWFSFCWVINERCPLSCRWPRKMAGLVGKGAGR